LYHAVFAEQSARFTPLAADAMQQAIGVAFLGGEASVLVPDTGNAMPVTVSERHLFAEQTVSIPGLFNRGSHVRCFALRPLNVNSGPFNTSPGQKHSRSCPDFSDFFTFRRPATTHFRDEHLSAKLPGGGGRVKVEAGAGGRTTLTRPTPPYKDDALARYAMDGLGTKMLVREYLTALRTESALAAELARTRDLLERQAELRRATRGKSA
jgi:hypothetical protein